MALTYQSTVVGTMKVHNEKHTQTRTLEMRYGNADCIIIYPYQKDGERYHQLYGFIADKEHARNMIKSGVDIFDAYEIDEVRLDMAYKENKTVLDYLHHFGHEVITYNSKFSK